MPNRIIKEAINESKGLGDCSSFAQDLYKRLITYADDYGRFNADHEIMRARLYPRELETVTNGDLLEALIELIGCKKLSFYIGDEEDCYSPKIYGRFPKWEEHQRVRNVRAKHPAPKKNINKWYLEQFVPLAMKARIFERDIHTCKLCNKSYYNENIPTKRAVRILSPVLKARLIKPVSEGGRATEDNLRLVCEGCSYSQDAGIDIEEIIRIAGGGEPRPVAAEPVPEADDPPEEEEKYAPDSQEVIMAAALKKYILENNPKARTPDDLTRWAEEIDRMIRIDERTPDEIMAMITFSQKDAFWSGNILSAKKLREKYDQLYMKSKRGGARAEPQAWENIRDWLNESEGSHAP